MTASEGPLRELRFARVSESEVQGRTGHASIRTGGLSELLTCERPRGGIPWVVRTARPSSSRRRRSPLLDRRVGELEQDALLTTDLLPLRGQLPLQQPLGKRFEPLPKRWVIERTFGWLMQHRRLARHLTAVVLYPGCPGTVVAERTVQKRVVRVASRYPLWLAARGWEPRFRCPARWRWLGQAGQPSGREQQRGGLDVGRSAPGTGGGPSGGARCGSGCGAHAVLVRWWCASWAWTCSALPRRCIGSSVCHRARCSRAVAASRARSWSSSGVG